MNYDKVKIKETENEILSPDDRKVSEMLRGLRIIEAPKDFDHRLMARIARSSAAAGDSSRSFFPVLRYVLPLGLLFVIGAAFIWNGSLNYNQNGVPAVAESVQPFVLANTDRPLPSESNRSIVRAEALQPRLVPTVSVRDKRAVGRRTKFLPRNIGKIRSSDILFVNKALKQSPNPILRRGQFTVKEMLVSTGLDAEFGVRGWKVMSVVPNSQADISGIRSGDLMEAVDGKPLTDKIVFMGPYRPKTIIVMREAKILVIDLKNK